MIIYSIDSLLCENQMLATEWIRRDSIQVARVVKIFLFNLGVLSRPPAPAHWLLPLTAECWWGGVSTSI